jgi:hypothetical protein
MISQKSKKFSKLTLKKIGSPNQTNNDKKEQKFCQRSMAKNIPNLNDIVGEIYHLNK